MRIALTSDWHIGSYHNGPMVSGINGRLLDIKARITEFLQYVFQNKIELVILAGDIFRDKHPHPIFLELFASVLRQLLNRRCTTIVLVGNHDRERSRLDTHALRPFMPLIESSPVHIIENCQVCKIGDLDFVLCPYMGPKQNEDIQNILKHAPANPIVVVHGIIQGGRLNPLTDYEIPLEHTIHQNALDPARAVLAGDLHMHQTIADRIYYPGSLERLDFGDELSAKGFLDITITPETIQHKFIPVQARRMVTLGANQISEVETGTIDIKDAIVRVTGVNKNDVQQVQQVLTKQGAYFVTGIHTLEHQRQEVARSGVNLPEFVKRFATKTKYAGDIDTATQRVQELLDANA